MRGEKAVLCCVAFFCLWTSTSGLLSAKGVNYEGNWTSFLVKPFVSVKY